ncbi:peptidylprolyl isomerase [Moraxella lacunata]|nr:peptidylprolyl isomerase [Moraxella lacunata]OBX66363.1 peptidylprolyl isomerase [Moraxella lacunata]
MYGTVFDECHWILLVKMGIDNIGQMTDSPNVHFTIWFYDSHAQPLQVQSSQMHGSPFWQLHFGLQFCPVQDWQPQWAFGFLMMSFITILQIKG